MRNGASDLAVCACGCVLLHLPTFSVRFRVVMHDSQWVLFGIPVRSGDVLVSLYDPQDRLSRIPYCPDHVFMILGHFRDRFSDGILTSCSTVHPF